jgi:Ca2+-transporting ATPase
MTVTRLWAGDKFFEISGNGSMTRGKFLLDGEEINLKDYPAALDALWVGVLNNDASLEPIEGSPDAYRIIGDPTEGSILVAGAKAGLFTINTTKPIRGKTRFPLTRCVNAWSPCTL